MVKYLLSILVVLKIIAVVPGQTRYEVIDLGSLGGASSGAWAINDSSQVVGISELPNGSSHAFLWDNGILIDLGTLGGSNSEALDINNLSQIVGTSSLSNNQNAGFLWNNGQMANLGVGLELNAINDLTQIVGKSSGNSAFIWENGLLFDLGTFGGIASTAKGINNIGQVIGYYTYEDNFETYYNAFLWHNGQMTELGNLGIDSRAEEINDLSQIVGNSRVQLTYDYGHAFLWENGIMQDLGTLSGLDSRANSINDSSQIVGFSGVSFLFYHACIWYEGSVYDLNNLIPENSGWLLWEARDINNKGEIVGWGIYNEQPRAFLLRPVSLRITNPQAGEKWIAGETDTIKWTGGQAGQFFQIDYSTDSGQTYNIIDIAVPADSNYYIWNIPNNLLSTKCKIKLTDAQTFAEVAVSDLFKLKGYLLTRLDANDEYVVFSPAAHGWSYLNGSLWPQSWWNQFKYTTAIDPYTNEPYPSFFFSIPDSSFIDWPLWVEVFGEDQCYWFTQVIGLGSSYKGKAQQKWKEAVRPHRGSCFGFAASSFLTFNFRDQFFQKHPDIQNVANIFSLNISIPIRKTINGYFAHQFGKQSLDNDVTGQVKDPRTTLIEVMNMFKNDVVDISTITIYRSSGGAHTMAPISVTVDNTGPSRYRVNLYDSNNPGLNTPYILVDSLNNTWQDFTGLGIGWNGSNKFYLEIPISNYLNTPTLGKTNDNQSRYVSGFNNFEFYNTDKANIIYTASNGNRIGIVNGNLIDEISNGIPIHIKNGVPSAPIGYYIPDDTYSVVIDNIKDSIAQISVFKTNAVYTFERFDVDSTQTDRFRFDEGFSVASPDLDDKQINLTVIARLDSSERILFIQEAQLRQNDSLYLKEINQNDFIIKNYGTSKNYKLEINERSETESDIFQNTSVELANNSSHILAPNWADLTNSQLTIFVDEGNDGTIDDTLYVANTVDVKDERSLLSPKSYNLAQNYPNPFNPTTTIQYSIPQRSNVTLKVYDILGNEIATLVNEEKERGVYSVDFNVSQLASAIYLYRIQAGSFIQTKKMILLR